MEPARKEAGRSTGAKMLNTERDNAPYGKIYSLQDFPSALDSRRVNLEFHPWNEPGLNPQMVDSIHSPPRFESVKTAKTAPKTVENASTEQRVGLCLQAPLAVLVRRADEAAEQRMRLQRLGFELGVELAAEEIRVAGQLTDFDELAVA